MFCMFAKKNDLEEPVQEALIIIRFAEVNKTELAYLTPKEREIQIAFLEKTLRRQKSENEIRAIMLKCMKTFIPAPELAWRYNGKY